ncbi:GTP pyrophosphokinase [Fulvivirga sediminis]|uniref:RelA/SpoT domain-containing protein n=1 Tax=Fulvivirga sediminis TaxID=2803949 RepID=A0A937K273_9BACT|nr:hypothetical protein [Fulvivirga sediminis]MBL3658271.1 hypothetical protein [Fulvivirga sediminis]
MSEEKLIDEFRKFKPKLSDLSTRLEALLKTLVANESIQFHQITSRVKTEDSLKKKIRRKEKYSDLNQITDLLGVRVITYFDDDVDRIAHIISDEFEIDENNSTDKRNTDSTSFGYKSLHFVVELSNQRLTLSEWKNYVNYKFEVQIRSILQHTWAEIEHDLGYKASSEIPMQEKRSFARISAVLEMVDQEFRALRDRLIEYETTLPLLIQESPETVKIDRASVNEFIKNNALLNEIDLELARQINVKIDQSESKFPYSEMIDFFEIKNIKELQEILEQNREGLIQFATEYLNRVDSIVKGQSLYILPYLLTAKTGNKTKIENYIKALSIGKDSEAIANRIMTTYQVTQKNTDHNIG